ncbi:MAG: hypothetical protein ABL973_02190 [Micropepsaceae bacterium]
MFMVRGLRNKLILGAVSLAAIVAGLALAFAASPNAGHQMPVTIRSDDPRVTILSVSQYGKPVAARGVGSPQVAFTLLADEDGIPCDLDEVEVRTSNAVVHYPHVNVCESRGLVQLSTARVERPAGLTADPELKWIADKAVDSPAPLLMLTYGVPQTDGSVMFSKCLPGSGRITTLFYGDTTRLERSKVARLDFHAPSVVFRYDAVIHFPESQGMEESLPFEVEQSARNAFWTVLVQGYDMAYRSPDSKFHLLDTRRNAVVVGQFVKACRG